MQDDQITQQIFTHLIGKAAVSFAQGKSRSQIIEDMVNEGCPKEAAEAIATVARKVKGAEFRKGGQTAMLIGAGLAMLGIAITAGTHAMAEANGGGHYVIAYGLTAC